MDFEDVRLCAEMDKIRARAVNIAQTRNLSGFKELGAALQSAYDYVITAQSDFTEQQPMLKNMFSAFNYGAVIVNDALKNKALDKEAVTLLNECLEIIIACCDNVKNSFSK